VHSGDLFDTVKPKTKALLVAMRALDLLKEAGIPFIAIAGNHSMPKNAYTASAFEILKKAHPEIHAAYSFQYEHVQIGDTHFHLIPNMLHAADYKKAAFDASAYTKEKGNHVLVTHGLATTIRDKRLATCAEFELTPDILLDTYDYIALGHYHGQQQIAPNAWYSGSQEHLTYGEIKDRKGALQVWIEDGVTTVDHLSLARSPMKDLGVIDCDQVVMDDIIDAIENEVGLIDGVGDQMFQLTLDFGNSPVAALQADALKDIRESILDLKIRIRSQETERQQIQQQDLHAIDYVREFGTFLQHRQLSDAQRAAVEARGNETLKTVMANHAEETS
jgi:DNA repair exonuclease SbcCD nuclease subunit